MFISVYSRWFSVCEEGLPAGNCLEKESAV